MDNIKQPRVIRVNPRHLKSLVAGLLNVPARRYFDNPSQARFVNPAPTFPTPPHAGRGMGSGGGLGAGFKNLASFGATLGCLCLAGDDFGVPWGAFGSLWAAFGGARGSFSKRLVVHFPKCLKLDPPAGLKTLFQQMFFSSNKFQKE